MQEPRAELHRLVDDLPDAELSAARRFLQFLSEDSVGPEFTASLLHSIAQADAGETIVCCDYDDMVKKLLDE